MARDTRKLRPTSPWMLIALAVVSGVTVCVLVFVALRGGLPAVPIPPAAAAVPLVIGIIVLWLAWGVRRYQRHQRTMDQIVAARIWVLTQATSRAGAILTGAAGGVAGGYVLSGPTAFLVDNAINAVVAAVGALAMTIMAVIGERWCESDPPESNASEAKA